MQQKSKGCGRNEMMDKKGQKRNKTHELWM